MYFFYLDESGSRDPSVGDEERPKDHLYVLVAVGVFERQWFHFDRAIANLKLELADHLHRQGKGRFDLADCEVKSNWIRNPKERARRSPFLNALAPADLTRIVDCYYRQLQDRKAVLMAAVVDKRHLLPYMDQEKLHKKAYEFLLERIEQYMAEFHPKHLAVVVMDDTSRQLNRAVAMKHAYFQRAGNQNVAFRHLVEYPFFTRSELSNGIQLADLVAYNVYRAFKHEDFDYPHFSRLWSSFYRRSIGTTLDGLKVWPEASPLIEKARTAWGTYRAGVTA